MLVMITFIVIADPSNQPPPVVTPPTTPAVAPHTAPPAAIPQQLPYTVQIIPPTTVPPALQNLLNTLGPNWQWLVAPICYLFALGAAMKLVAPKIQTWASDFVARNVDTIGSDHDKVLRAILGSVPYRIASTLVDMALSINLPTMASYLKQLAAQGTPVAAPDPVAPSPATPAPQPAAPQPPAAPMPKLGLLALLLLPVAFMPGCSLFSSSSGVSSTGVYAQIFADTNGVATNTLASMVIIQGDQIYGNAVQLITQTGDWELANHAYLASNYPAVVKYVNYMRLNAPVWEEDYRAARAQFIRNPVSTNQTFYQNAVAILQAGQAGVSNQVNTLPLAIFTNAVVPAPPPPVATNPPAVTALPAVIKRKP